MIFFLYAAFLGGTLLQSVMSQHNLLSMELYTNFYFLMKIYEEFEFKTR